MDAEAIGPHPAATADVRASMQQLAHVFEDLRDGCIFVDHAIRVQCMNATARRHTAARGEDPARFPGHDLWELLQYAPESSARQAFERSVRERVATSFTTKGTVGDFWIEVDVAPLEDGTLLYYRDATSRSAAAGARVASEIELHVASERLRILMGDAPLAVFVLDDDANVVHWNPAAERMFRWSAAEVLGKPLPFVPEEDRAGFEASLAQMRDGASLGAKPERRRRKDGVVLDVQISSSPMRNPSGELVGSIVMAMDVTAQRKLETQLRMAQKMEAVGLLAGGIAHDMSLVGPRPLVLHMLDAYPEILAVRSLARPGITGLWQVNDRANCTHLFYMLPYDLEYLRTMSMRTDLRILIRTVGVAISGAGAI